MSVSHKLPRSRYGVLIHSIKRVFRAACQRTGALQLLRRQQGVAQMIKDWIDGCIDPAERGRLTLQGILPEAKAGMAVRRTRPREGWLDAGDEREQVDTRRKHLAERPEPPGPSVTEHLEMPGADPARVVARTGLPETSPCGPFPLVAEFALMHPSHSRDRCSRIAHPDDSRKRRSLRACPYAARSTGDRSPSRCR
jgi:hypothetical protein